MSRYDLALEALQVKEGRSEPEGSPLLFTGTLPHLSL